MHRRSSLPAQPFIAYHLLSGALQLRMLLQAGVRLAQLPCLVMVSPLSPGPRCSRFKFRLSVICHHVLSLCACPTRPVSVLLSCPASFSTPFSRCVHGFRFTFTLLQIGLNLASPTLTLRVLLHACVWCALFLRLLLFFPLSSSGMSPVSAYLTYGLSAGPCHTR